MAEYSLLSLSGLLSAGLKRFLLLCALCLSGFLPAQAQDEFPPLTGRVVDLAGLLDEAQENALVAQLFIKEIQ